MYNWNQIRSIRPTELKTGLIPKRLMLERWDGLKVTAGGWSWTEAAVALFSTAGYGRFTPLSISAALFRDLDNRDDIGIMHLLDKVEEEIPKFKI